MFRARRRRTEVTNCRRAPVRRLTLIPETLEPRRLLSSFLVDNTANSGPGSLRAAMVAANADPSPGTDDIFFDIPASTAPDLNVPAPGFDPNTQTWKITLNSPLPTITRAVSIDGYTQAHFPISYVYPASISSSVQTVSILGSPTGGTFKLATSAPLPVGITAAIAYTADAGTVQNALGAIIGAGNVVVTGGPLPNGSLTITFQGADAGQAIPDLSVTNNSLTGGISPSVLVTTATVGGVAGMPTLISSVPNTVAALDGNNAKVRVIIDGSLLASGPADVGFVINASNSILRGLSIDGFGVGVSVPNPGDVGDLIQGNFIGDFVVYPVDPNTGVPLPSPNTVILVVPGNAQQGVSLGSTNTTVGGTDPQDNNVISGNGAQGVLLQPGTSGNQVLGNQIGVVGPIIGYYYQVGNGAEGVLIQSSGIAGNPASIVYSSSNIIGGAVAGAGNVISANSSYGVHIVGVGATRNLVEANYIGAAPGGGYVFGSGDPGNGADGVRIDDGPDNQVGGGSASSGNVISSNQGAGVYITGLDAVGNTVKSNIIGLTAGGSTVLGNDQVGVADYAAGTMIGPGNVISANLIGVLISGAAATNVTVIDNLIGTDASGEADLGNARAGVEIDSATGVIVEGNGQGSQVISGNLVGVSINGPSATGILVAGNFIGTDKAGTADRGNSNEGVLIEGASGNTVGGTVSGAGNAISTNHWGIRIDGAAATNNVIEGNFIGTDVAGTVPLGNEVNGIIISNDGSDNTIGGTGGGQGNTIAFNVAAGVSVQSGSGNSILSNSIFSNGNLGIELIGTANNSQSAPAISGVSGGGTGSNIQGSFTSVLSTSFLIQFFSSQVPDPSGYGQGQTFLGSTTVTTDASGKATINFNLSGDLVVGAWVTVTATNQSTGDTSAFSNAVSAQPVSVAFSMPDFPVGSTDGSVMVDVQRSGNLTVAVSVSYATSNSTAIAGQDYTAVSNTLTFPPNQTDEIFSVPILANANRSTPFSTVNLTLSQPSGGATLGAINSATVTIANQSNPNFMTFLVVNTNDSGAGTLRDAIASADNDHSPGTDNIVFDIPTSTAPDLNIPVPGFDPSNQTWKIALDSALPTITHSVVIDGYGQANVPVSYRYPSQISSAVQSVTVVGLPTGGTFTLRTLAPLVVGTTRPIPYNATAADIQAALDSFLPSDNFSVTGGPVNSAAGVTITFQGADAEQFIPNLIATNSLTGGIIPSVVILTTTVGGVLIGSPTLISSVPNSSGSLLGNNAQVRVIIDGGQVPSGPADIGFAINASNSILRGLAIGGFGVGVSVPTTADVGDLIQGNFIGVYLSYPVDPLTGLPLPAPNNVVLAGQGNTQQGLVLGSRNATVGGTDSQAANVIGGNGAQGVWIEPGASGNQVLDNQIGVAGPSSNGRYFQAGNGAEGVLIQSSGTASDPSSIVYASSNIIGGAVAGAGNIISANHSFGVHIVGVGATRNLVEANYIGAAPGGGYLFGNGRPGNGADGVRIDDAPNNQIGGGSATSGNVISSNQAAGVSINGVDAIGNTVESNIIGLTADGSAVLGNDQAGVTDTAPGTVIGPGNVISANLIGVLISGPAATGVVVRDNLIGTDLTGEADLGNAQAGIDIESASGITVEGNGQGSQVISGNLVGVEINGSTSTQNLVEGNFIGTDKAGVADRGNSNEGVLIEGAFGNTVGGTTAGARNVISANHWGIRLDGATATANLIEGNDVGADTTGIAPLGNEINGVIISNSASGNSIGGTGAGQGNTIAFNVAAGVIVQSGTGDAILSNSIFSNGQIGISLTGTGNDLIAAPVLMSAAIDTSTNSTNVQGTYTSQPSSTFLIQFFSNVSADPAGKYEGQTFIGSATVTTDGTGAASFDVELPIIVSSGTWITATVTYLKTTVANPALHQGDTSEFSLQVQAINPFIVTTTLDSGAVGTLRYAITYSNANPSISSSAPNQIQFLIPAVGLQTISLSSGLPSLTEPVVIDGYSQPGSSTNVTLSTLDDQETDVAVLTIQIDGSQIGSPDANGLTIAAPNCTVDGLSITGFSGAGISLEPRLNTVSGALGDTIWGNFIGVSQFNSKTYNPVSSKTANANGVGILIDSPNNVIGGTTPPYRNVIQGNRGDGVILYGSQGTRNTLDTNFILDNGGDGVLVLSANNQVGQAIGLGPAGAGNVISGNAANGVHILGPSARDNVVANNEIGTQIGLAFAVSFVTIRGTQPRPNSGDGVLIENAPTNVIGGQIPDAGNVIAGNTSDGVAIENYVDGTVPSIIQSAPIVVDTPAASATSNDVQGNSIGFNNRNLLIYPIPNQDGVDIASSGNLIGGDLLAARNIIILNNRNGVTISDSQLDSRNNPLGVIPNATPNSNVVEGNFIGTQAGNNDYGNTLDGVLLFGAGGNTIGGTTSAALNVISTNNTGIMILTAASTSNVVAGNDIGTTSDGTRPLGNFSDGVAILDSPGNVIGGSVAGAGNIIAGNGGNGVHLSGSSATGNILWGNLIGTSSSGGDLLGNFEDGVFVENNASNNLIGETSSGAGASNTIAFNAGSGVGISSGTGNSILSNSIFSNTQRGIVLSGTGNDAQTAPALTAAIPSSSSTAIQGTLSSVPGTSFEIQFFSNAVADPSGYGQGQTLIGAATLVTNSSGSNTFSLTIPTVVAPGLVVAATATNLSTGDTSAFSVDVISSPIDLQFIQSAFVANASTGQATITVKREGNPNAQVTVSFTTSNGTAQAGINYTSTSGTLIFNSGVSVRSFTIPFITGAPPSDGLTVNMSLANPTGGAGLGTPSAAVLTILDNRAPGLQFSSAQFQVSETAGLAMITVYRVSNLNGTVTVGYAATAGTAIPGVDFTPVSGTLTFLPGVGAQSFTVPVQTNSPNTNDATVNLTLSNQTGGAVLGTPSTATLTITKPLTFVSEQVVTNGRAITGIAFTFSKPLNTSRAQDLGNYGYYAVSGGRGAVFTASGYTALSSAVYNPATNSVTLTPGAPLPLNTFFRITIDGQASPLLNNGITDLAGNQLAGSSGAPGTPYVTTFAVGPKLVYTDGERNVVTLQLKRGGVMEMFRSAIGEVVQLQLAGTIARKSTLSGSVSRGRGGTGRTFLPPIAGTAGVRIQLRTPPFFFGSPTLAKTASRSAAMDKAQPAATVTRLPFSGPRWHR